MQNAVQMFYCALCVCHTKHEYLQSICAKNVCKLLSGFVSMLGLAVVEVSWLVYHFELCVGGQLWARPLAMQLKFAELKKHIFAEFLQYPQK